MVNLDRLNTLCNMLKAGDIAVLDEIYAMVGSRLYHIALAIVRQSHLAEDVLQETMIALCKGISNYRSTTNAYGYIAKISQNTAINLANRERRKGASYIDIADDITLGASESPYDNIESQDRVARILAQLPPEDRQVVYLKYYSEMTVREIAKAIGMSKSSVARTISRAESVILNLIKEGM